MGDPDRSHSRRRVVVIDDDRDVRDVMTEVLELAGYEVSVPSDAHVAIDDLAATQPDLIVLDLFLSDDTDQGGGWDYLRLLRSHQSLGSVPVVIVSADVAGLRGHAADVLMDPLVSVLEKPFSVDQLERAVAGRLRTDGLDDGKDWTAIVLIADAEARLLSASPAALQLLGLGADELRLRRVADIVAHGTEWTRREWERYLVVGRWEGPVTLRLPDGREVDAFSRAQILSEGGVDVHVTRLEIRSPATV